MTTNKVDAINTAVKKWMQEHGKDEQLFELGIELGKHLATVGDEYERLACFIEREEKNDKDKAVGEILDDIDEKIKRLFKWACRDEMKESGRLDIDAGDWGRGGAIYSDEYGEKYCVKSKCVSQEHEGMDFEIECEVVGDLKEILDRYGVGCNVEATILNSSGEGRDEYIRDMDDLENSLYGVRLVRYGKTVRDDIESAKKLKQEVEEWFMVMLLRHEGR